MRQFILLKNYSDRIGILYQNSDRIRIQTISDRILNIRQLSDYKRPIRCTPLFKYIYIIVSIYRYFKFHATICDNLQAIKFGSLTN